MTPNDYVRWGLVFALSVSVTACADDPDPRTVEEPSLFTPGPSNSSPGSLPASSPAVSGVRVAVPSHCGVLSVTVKGRLWLADPRLGDHNPPPGWDENQTMGSLVTTGPGRAVFYGDGGQRALFRRATAGAKDPNAGCE